MRYRNVMDHGPALPDPLGELGRLCGIDALSLDKSGHCSLLLDDLRTINLYCPSGQVWMRLSVEVSSQHEAQIAFALQRAGALASAACSDDVAMQRQASRDDRASASEIRSGSASDRPSASMQASPYSEGIALLTLADGRLCLQKTVDTRLETGLRLLRAIDSLCDSARRCEAAWVVDASTATPIAPTILSEAIYSRPAER